MREDYEFIQGTPEQIEVFLDLQRMIVRMYNKWPGDTAVAVFASALGCVTAMIETQFKIHIEECETCRKDLSDEFMDLATVARDNFDHYYTMEHEQAAKDRQSAQALIDRFFNLNGKAH